jgi:hypothetical protein
LLLAASLAVLAGGGPKLIAGPATPDSKRATADGRPPAAAFDSARALAHVRRRERHHGSAQSRAQAKRSDLVRRGDSRGARGDGELADGAGRALRRDSPPPPHRRVLRESELEEDGRAWGVSRAADAVDARRHRHDVAQGGSVDTRDSGGPPHRSGRAGIRRPDGKFRRRENPQTIEEAHKWAQSRQGLLFLDIQAGRSTLQQELPMLVPYLERPDVHLGVDPEFYMHYKREGIRPSVKVGQMMSSDVNGVIQALDKLGRDKNLPPKILVVHRFRADMLPDAEHIKPTPRVQVVMHMDGWGPAWLKFDSYKDYIVRHPVAFTGFKVFYHHDAKGGDAILTPLEVLRLLPHPFYIQYQ